MPVPRGHDRVKGRGMGIEKAFDSTSEEILRPEYIAPKVEGFPEKVIVTFRQKILDVALALYGGEAVSEMHAGVRIPIYQIPYKRERIGAYLTWSGGPATVGLLEEVIANVVMMKGHFSILRNTLLLTMVLLIMYPW